MRHISENIVNNEAMDIFGNRTRTGVLLALALLEESHASELGRVLGLEPSTVQHAVRTLEQDSLIAGRLEGRTRRLRLNPGFFARDELRALLLKIAMAHEDLLQRVSQVRRRARRSGKPL